MKVLAAGETGTVDVESIDGDAVITRDLSDKERSRQAIQDYSDAYSDGVDLPPVEVFLVDGRMVLVDGFHRREAQKLRRSIGIVARCVGAGSLEEAVRYALRETNTRHGLRLSPADYRVRVFKALDSGMWDGSSARAIARDLGISNRTASKYMAEWESEQGALPPTITDSKGREQPSRKPRRKPKATTPQAAADVSEAATEMPERSAGPDDDGRVYVHTSPQETPKKPVEEPTPTPTPTPTAQPMPGYGPALEETAAELASVRRAARARIPEGLNALRQRLDRLTREAETACRTAVPAVCANCEGSGCRTCGRRGWVTSVQGV